MYEDLIYAFGVLGSALGEVGGDVGNAPGMEGVTRMS